MLLYSSIYIFIVLSIDFSLAIIIVLFLSFSFYFLYVILIELLLYSRHCLKYFMVVISLIPDNNPLR